jgi:CRISPR/Cas system type I-B associated protein Csh2 (Cas7 group RAMP superfamily)
MRQQVEKRDNGVCGVCGKDTNHVQSNLLKLMDVLILAAQENSRKFWHTFDKYHSQILKWISRNKIKHLKAVFKSGVASESVDDLKLLRENLSRTLWEADHIVPVAEGGGACGLENIRTLCRRCHHTATMAMRERRRTKDVGDS